MKPFADLAIGSYTLLDARIVQTERSYRFKILLRQVHVCFMLGTGEKHPAQLGKRPGS